MLFNKGQFCSSSLENWACLEAFLVITTGEIYWHLVGRGQGCCETSNNVYTTATTTKNYLDLNARTQPRQLSPWLHLLLLTTTSLLFLKHSQHSPASQPLPLLFPLPGKSLFSDDDIAHFLTAFRFLLKYHYLKSQCPFHHRILYLFLSSEMLHFKSCYLISIYFSHH